MDTHVWEALPQRKRRRDKNAAAVNVSSPTIDGDCANVHSNSSVSDVEQRSDVQHQQTITDNVYARSNLQRKNATLESLDGCAGEFYECEEDVCIIMPGVTTILALSHHNISNPRIRSRSYS